MRADDQSGTNDERTPAAYSPPPARISLQRAVRLAGHFFDALFVNRRAAHLSSVTGRLKSAKTVIVEMKT